jgi:hypothetical protein
LFKSFLISFFLKIRRSNLGSESLWRMNGSTLWWRSANLLNCLTQDRHTKHHSWRCNLPSIPTARLEDCVSIVRSSLKGQFTQQSNRFNCCRKQMWRFEIWIFHLFHYCGLLNYLEVSSAMTERCWTRIDGRGNHLKTHDFKQITIEMNIWYLLESSGFCLIPRKNHPHFCSIGNSSVKGRASWKTVWFSPLLRICPGDGLVFPLIGWTFWTSQVQSNSFCVFLIIHRDIGAVLSPRKLRVTANHLMFSGFECVFTLLIGIDDMFLLSVAVSMCRRGDNPVLVTSLEGEAGKLMPRWILMHIWKQSHSQLWSRNEMLQPSRKLWRWIIFFWTSSICVVVLMSIQTER